MSCGGDARTNRNAAAIRDALAYSSGTLTVHDGRGLFHRLAEGERSRLADEIRSGHGRQPTWHESRGITQAAHAAARARLPSEIAAVEAVLDANDANTETYARQAAAWAARDPRTAAHFPPEQAAAAVRLIRRKKVVTAFTWRGGGSTQDRAARAVDPQPGEAEPGGGQLWLAAAARDRAETSGTSAQQAARAASKKSRAAQARWRDSLMPEQERQLLALHDRLHRVAKLEAAFGAAQPQFPDDWNAVVDHNDPYGPALQTAWDALGDSERTVLAMRLGAPHGDPTIPPRPHTLEEIADRLQVERERVRSLQARAEAKLRRAPKPPD